ncbi:MAG: thiolase family protein [Acidimicrobiales bacterium]
MSNNIAILGVGMHPFGRFGSTGYADMGRHAALDALRDANVEWKDIEAAYLSAMYLPATAGARILKPLGATGIPICDVEAACASGGVALAQAIQAIRSGAINLAMVLGVEKMPRGFMDPAMIYEPWQVAMGLSTNPSYWALRARRHMHDYGTTEEDIANIAVKNHRNSTKNPNAMYQKEFSFDDVMTSPLVCDPIRLLEICAPNEGAAAVVIGKASEFKSASAVTVTACVHRIARYGTDLRAPIFGMPSTISDIPSPTMEASRRAYEIAGMSPGDIDLFEVQDTDSFCELEAYEELGLCHRGEGAELFRSGATEPGGTMPVNVSGGLISKGEPVGASHLGQLAEIVWQIRGKGGDRQVPSVRSGLAHVLGVGGNCAVTILAA